MQFGIDWLQDYLDTRCEPAELERELPLAGFEVESMQPAAAPFHGVVVAKVLDAVQHPNADRLRLCTVTDGSTEMHIVCGAPNARKGIMVALAQIGAVLPGDFKIKKSKIRGEVSHGMLCSGAELGMSDDQEGIIELAENATLGMDIRQLLHLDEPVIDIDITPNRGDCLSVRGLAREVATLTKTTFTDKHAEVSPATIDDARQVMLDDPASCPVYVGRILNIGTPGASSPQWIQDRLIRAGLRPLNLIVDITNLVMLDIGQPLHAFDNKKLSGTVRVRRAKKGEKLTLLNDQITALDGDKLVISDDSGPIALAGIMGGQLTEIEDGSDTIFLEAAHFSAHAIAGRARHYGLHTDASMRFERGVDWQLPAVAIEMATTLLVQYAGAKAGPIIETTQQQHLPKTVHVDCDLKRFNRLAGISFDGSAVERDLQSLGFGIQHVGEGRFTAESPSWRYDIERPEDIFEEALRIHGFSKVPDVLPKFSRPVSFGSDLQLDTTRFQDHLVGLGYQEVVSYSFIDEPSQLCFLDEGYQSIQLANPISADLAHMRHTLTPSLLKTLAYNIRHQHKDMCIFETGLCFQANGNDNIEQFPVLAMAALGNRPSDSWKGGQVGVDFFGIKGDVESLLALVVPENTLSFVAQEYKGFHPKQCAQILIDGISVGYIGAIHPGVLKVFDLDGYSPFVCQLDLNPVTRYQRPVYSPISVFPKVYRDIALIVDRSIQWQQIEDCITGHAEETLIRIAPFDIYQSDDIGSDKKSVAVRLWWQSTTETLTDTCIRQQVDVILQGLRLQIKAELRS